MPTRCLPSSVAVALLLGANLMAAPEPQGATPQRQPPPSFRSNVTAVPIDVRVVDRNGNPVMDLRQEDFTVFEDDVRQPLTHFSRQVLVARSPGPSLRARADVPSFDASPQTHRVFLIVLGSGALGSRPLGPGTRIVEDPTKALEGLLHLVRDRLLPQDQVALLAYNRASDFSADHEAVAALLAAFRESEGAGLAALVRHGAAAPLRSPADSAFGVPGDLSLSAQSELGFAEYVSANGRPSADAENLQYGIKYLRYMDGEKHLIYVTAHGILQPPLDRMDPMVRQWMKQWEVFNSLAAAATDARVALHVIQTGGVSAAPGPFLQGMPIMTPRIILPGRAYFGTGGSDMTTDAGPGTGNSASPQPGWDRPPPAPAVPIPGMDAVGLMALKDLRTLALKTGGHASIMGDAVKAIDRIDAQTRVDYLLAYNPSNVSEDGRYRTVKVEVNRPGVTVLFRHGYYARAEAATLSRRSVVADSRLAAAAASTRQRRDIVVTATPTFTKNRKGKGGELIVQMVIDATRLGWTTDDLSRRVAHLDVGVLCGDAREKVVGQTRRELDVTITEERFARAITEGLPYSVRLPVAAPPSFLKIVVYNYDADLVGSTVVWMEK